MNATPIAVADTSARFQTSVKSGGATFTGFRDKVGYRFLGIDFADFDQRFDYSSVVNATGAVSALAIKPHCWQIDGIEYRTNGVEHCLNLNVFTNYLPNGNSNSTALKPVFMWYVTCYQLFGANLS
jgi:carboxylesterase type B